MPCCFSRRPASLAGQVPPTPLRTVSPICRLLSAMPGLQATRKSLKLLHQNCLKTCPHEKCAQSRMHNRASCSSS